jgi:hypothetical protein
MRGGVGGVLFNDRRVCALYLFPFFRSDGVDGVVGFLGCFVAGRDHIYSVSNEVGAHTRWSTSNSLATGMVL